MASLVDFYKQKLAPVGEKLSSFIDRDKSMPGTQLAQGGLINQLTNRGIIGVGATPSLAPVQVRPAQQFVSGALKPVADAVGTFGKLSFDAIVKQPARTRQMQLDTQKAIDASNRALQTAKLTREAGRPDLAAQMTRSMIPQLQSESQRFTDIGKEAQAKQKSLVGSGVRTGLYTSALLNPVAAVGAGALSSGLGAAFAGQTSPEQLGTSFGEGIKYGGMPNPIIKGGLLAKSVGGGLVNLAEDAFYAKTVEGRNLTPKEVALSLALPASFETGSGFLKAIKGKQKVDVTTTPDGLTYNKKGQLFDPISGQFAKSTEEARLAVQHVKDFISSGGKPVKSQTRLVEVSPNKWVDEQDLTTYASEIETPKLSVEPNFNTQIEYAKKFNSYPEFLESINQVGQGSSKKAQIITEITNKYGTLENFWRIANAKQPKISSRELGLNSQPFLKPKPLSVEPVGGKVNVSDLTTKVLKNEDIVRSLMNGEVFKMQLDNGRVVAFGDKAMLARLSGGLGDDVTDIIPAKVGRGKTGEAGSGIPRLILESQDDLIKLKHAISGKSSQPPQVWDHVPQGAKINEDGRSFTWKEKQYPLKTTEPQLRGSVSRNEVTSTPNYTPSPLGGKVGEVISTTKPLSVEPVGGKDLLSEARKYKSAEEYLKKTLSENNIEKTRGFLTTDGKVLDMGLDQHPLLLKEAGVSGNADKAVENGIIRLRNTIGSDGVGEINIQIGKKPTTEQLTALKNLPENIPVIFDININGKTVSSPLGGSSKNEFLSQLNDIYGTSPSPIGGKVEPKTVTPIRKSLKEVYSEQLTKGADTLQPSTPLENIQPVPRALDNLGISTTPQPVSQTIQTVRKITQLDQPSESIIQEARKQIGSTPDPKDKSIKEVLDDTYSSWVDRYNPLTKASDVAKKTLKGQGAELRPEYDPTYLVRRLTGAGGIADQRFRTELNPILKEMESLNIPKADMDVYLANKRMAGFGKAGRDIYGTDPIKAGQVVSALEAKYPQISGVADKMYAYQDKGLNEIAQAGFLSPESIAALKSQNPDYAPLYRVMDEMDNYLGLPTRKTMQGTSPISKIKGSTRQIESPVESIIGNTFRQRAAIEKNRVAQSVIDLQKISPDLGFTKVAKSAPDTITVWKNGQKEYWRVGQDIADTAKGVNEESMNLLLKVLQAPASLLRQGATGRNPEFLLPNILRDNLDAGVTSKYGYIPFVDYFSGLISMAKNDDVYQKWANSGAKIDLGEISGKKSIQKLFDSKVEKKKLSTWLTQGLDVLGTLSEQPTRVGLFKKAYQKTGNEMLAMMESRDATVDFARMGSKMKVANSIIPFLNVGVQGFDKLWRAVKDSPGRVAFNAGIYGVLPALMTTLYNLNNDPESYNEIPQYEKDSNFVLVTGRNDDGTVDYLTFPKGNVIPSIANPIESFLAFTKNEDPEAFKRMLVSTLTGTLPVIGDGSTAGEVATKTIGGLIPQGIKPIAENLLNKSFYKYDPSKEQSKEIVPSYLQNKPDYQQTYEFTPQMYQKLGAVFDASPLKVKNLMEGYLAGFTKIPSQIYEMAYKASRGEEISPNDKTLIRRFIKQTYPSSGKAPQVKPESPGLMERVTGKVGAAETSVKKVIPEWQIDNAKTELKSSDKTSKKISDNLYLVKQANGDVSRLDLSNVTKMPSTTNYEQVKKETEKWKVADDILKLDPTDQVKAFKQLGISKDDAEYYTVAKDTTEAKAAYIKDQVQGVKNYDEFLTKVAPLTKQVNGEKILSDGVVDWMYQNDIITSSQKKQLKSLEFKGGKASLGKSKGTVKKITVKKLGKFNLAGKVKKVKRIRTKQYKLVTKTK